MMGCYATRQLLSNAVVVVLLLLPICVYPWSVVFRARQRGEINWMTLKNGKLLWDCENK